MEDKNKTENDQCNNPISGCFSSLFAILFLLIFLYVSACTANVIWMGTTRVVVGEAKTLPIANFIMNVIKAIFGLD